MNEIDIARDDLALDALAAGVLPAGDDETFGLLHALRADLDAQVADPDVAPVVPMRRKRSATLVALAAAAGLVVGGITAGAVAASDRPGELLYAAHKAVLGPADHSTADVTAVLDRAADAIARRDYAGARRLLAQALGMIGSLPEAERPPLLRRHATLSSYAVAPTPTATPSPDRHGGRTPTRSPEPGDDSGGSGSDDSGSSGSGSSGSGSDDSSGSGTSGSGTSGTSGTSGSTSGSTDDSGGDSSGSGSSGSGKTVVATPTVDSSGHGGGDDSGGDDH